MPLITQIDNLITQIITCQELCLICPHIFIYRICVYIVYVYTCPTKAKFTATHFSQHFPSALLVDFSFTPIYIPFSFLPHSNTIHIQINEYIHKFTNLIQKYTQPIFFLFHKSYTPVNGSDSDRFCLNPFPNPFNFIGLGSDRVVPQIF